MSIVIPARDVAQVLPAQLSALRRAVAGHDDVEVVVADNGSSDATAQVARDTDGLTVRVVDAARAPGINVARNEGIRASTGEVVLLCDADDEVDAQWLTEMRVAFDGGADLVGGTLDYRRMNPADVRAWRGADEARPMVFLGFLPAAHGANLGFRRSVFDAIGGFDEAFAGGGDDIDFCWRAQLAGFSLVDAPSARVHYRLRDSLAAVWRQAQGYGAAEALLYRRFRDAGLRRRPLRAPVLEVWWLLSRLPFSRPHPRRGAWVRRAGTLTGRWQGSARLGLTWW